MQIAESLVTAERRKLFLRGFTPTPDPNLHTHRLTDFEAHFIESLCVPLLNSQEHEGSYTDILSSSCILMLCRSQDCDVKHRFTRGNPKARTRTNKEGRSNKPQCYNVLLNDAILTKLVNSLIALLRTADLSRV